MLRCHQPLHNFTQSPLLLKFHPYVSPLYTHTYICAKKVHPWRQQYLELDVKTFCFYVCIRIVLGQTKVVDPRGRSSSEHEALTKQESRQARQRETERQPHARTHSYIPRAYTSTRIYYRHLGPTLLSHTAVIVYILNVWALSRTQRKTFVCGLLLNITTAVLVNGTALRTYQVPGMILLCELSYAELLSESVRVLFTFSTLRLPAYPVPVPRAYDKRDTSYVATKPRHDTQRCYFVMLYVREQSSRHHADTDMPCHRTGYDRHDILQILDLQIGS